MKKNIIKKNLFGFIIGGIIFGTITTVLATSIAASTILYTTLYNADLSNVNSAVVDLYYRAKTYINPELIKWAKLVHKYWNDDFEGNYYYFFGSPEDVYATRAELETAYGSSNFANSPIYIRSAFKENYAIYHEACFWYNNKEFCLAPNYWVGDSQDQTNGATTKAKIKADMEAALGITFADGDCSSNNNEAGCHVDGFGCGALNTGEVYCNSRVSHLRCGINVPGDVTCS